MDRKERPRGKSRYANTSGLAEDDRAVLVTPGGETHDRGADQPGSMTDEEVRRPVGATPRSQVTDQPQPGVSAEETADGLDDVEEAVRLSAEDQPVSDDEPDLPVFERPLTGPKV